MRLTVKLMSLLMLSGLWVHAAEPPRPVEYVFKPVPYTFDSLEVSVDARMIGAFWSVVNWPEVERRYA